MPTAYKYRRLDKSDAAVLLVDHQSGLSNIVGDFSPDDFKNTDLAALARGYVSAVAKKAR